MTENTLTLAEAAQLLADFVDVLLPGGDGWPSGAAVGVQHVLAQRLTVDRSPDSPAELVVALLRAGGPLAGQDEAARVAIVDRVERDEPALFGWVRDAAFITYYESPAVVAVINAKGRPYQLRPHITGYPTAPFDLERDAPKHGRGRYIAADAVQPIDIAALDLAAGSTTAWGLKR
jgi:hypothetical protein